MSSIRRISIIALAAASTKQGHAFTIHSPATRSLKSTKISPNFPSSVNHNHNHNHNYNYDINLSSPTALQMGYSLPPGGGGKPDPKDAISSVITPILTIIGTVLFFLSPLGSIFFAITNSIVLLLFLLPFLATIGFQGWQYFYTIEAPCPSCNSPARVLKDDDTGPNICLSCGSLLRVNLEKDGVELCNDPSDIYDDNSRVSSFFDLFTGGVDNDGGLFQGDNVDTSTTATSKKDKDRREGTIIDVDVTKED